MFEKMLLRVWKDVITCFQTSQERILNLSGEDSKPLKRGFQTSQERFPDLSGLEFTPT
jgi:hypothetical protein